MTPADLVNSNFFPRYIVVRRPANQGNGGQAEWQGFIKAIKQTIKINTIKMTTQLQGYSDKQQKLGLELKQALSTLAQEQKAIREAVQNQ